MFAIIFKKKESDNMKTKDMVLCAVFAAILCIFSVITIPIGIIPITLGFFGVMLTAGVLGWKKGTISVLVFFLLGIIGLPVFSNFRSGIAVFAGPTGGYLWSYAIMSLIIGFCAERETGNKWTTMLKNFIACIIAIIVSYTAGTVQFMYVQNTTLMSALTQCVVIFIPFDLLKAAAVVYLSYMVKHSLIRAKIVT